MWLLGYRGWEVVVGIRGLDDGAVDETRTRDPRRDRAVF